MPFYNDLAIGYLCCRITLMQRYFISLAYNGLNYHGWQVQNNAVTVQEKVNEALSVVLGELINCYGCGRTDTGVHASFFIAHFKVAKINPDLDLVFKLNSFLPKDIAIKKVFPVNEDAHARFSAESRTYEYRVHFNKDPFIIGQSLYLRKIPSTQKMQQACKILIQTKDFSSFCKVQSEHETHICELMEASLISTQQGFNFKVKANRFLRGMVRALMGTLLEVGYGKMTLERFKEVVALKDRKLAGPSVKAHGLFLVDIHYPKQIYIE